MEWGRGKSLGHVGVVGEVLWCRGKKAVIKLFVDIRNQGNQGRSDRPSVTVHHVVFVFMNVNRFIKV
jgi:hypothetical protein